jgi:hypothetical protein
VARTESEKREYQRGYNRAISRHHSRVKRVLEIAKGYRDRSAFRSTARCGDCERWTRGGSNCLWGYCRADFEWSAGEGKMWAEPQEAKIVTHEHFGCINWIPNGAGAHGAQADGERSD